MIYEIIETVDLTNNPFQILKRTDEDGKIWFIPCDSNNSDYQAYLKSLEGAN